LSHTGIVLTEAAEVFPARRRGRAICTLAAGHRLSVIERSATWLRVDAPGAAAEGAESVSGFVDASCVALADAEGRGHLAADLDLQAAEVEAPGSERLGGSGAHEAAVSRVWNLYGGLLAVLADRIGIDPAYAVAVVCVESGGQGFGADGRVIIRFENHIFRRYLGEAGAATFNRHFQVNGAQAWMGHTFRASSRQPWQAFHGSQHLEWQAYEVARAINEDAATRSISMGLPQVMGFNHGLLGYDTPRALLAFMGADIRFQLLGMFDFIAGPGGQGQGVAALRAGDFDRFATLYNGPGQARYYGDLIASHVRAFHRLKPAPRTTGGDSASSGSAASTVAKPSTATKPKNTPAPKRASVGAAGTYEVRAGDTLGVIAGRFGVALADLVSANAIDNPNLIHPGQVLAIPGAEPAPPPVIVPSAPPEDVTDDGPKDGHPYVVRPGDTLGAIAARAGTTFEELARVNEIANPDLIFPGQVILTPVPID